MCAVEVCHAIAGRAPCSKNAEAFLNDFSEMPRELKIIRE